MIRIESRLLVQLTVPYDPQKGNSSKSFVIPPMNEKTGEPGVIELPELDAVTLARLKWHYDRRPHDGNAADNAETDAEGNARFLKVGLLTITVVGGKPSGPQPTDAKEPANSLEPPRRAGKPAAKIKDSKRKVA